MKPPAFSSDVKLHAILAVSLVGFCVSLKLPRLVQDAQDVALTYIQLPGERTPPPPTFQLYLNYTIPKYCEGPWLLKPKDCRHTSPPFESLSFVGNESVLGVGTHFDMRRPTKVFILGNGGHIDVAAMAHEEYMMAGYDYNTIGVSWGWGADTTEGAGIELALFLKSLRDKYGLNMSRIHVVCFSTGCHTWGSAAKKLSWNGLVVPRLTALEPDCNQNFVGNKRPWKFCKQDATFVEVIHTKARAEGRMHSCTEPQGHVDFYPNGGYTYDAGDLGDNLHQRSVHLFVESISKGNFWSWRCDQTADEFVLRGYSCAYERQPLLPMGEHSDLQGEPKHGIYFLLVHESPPFSLGDACLSPELGNQCWKDEWEAGRATDFVTIDLND